MSELATHPAPVRETERIVALDVLRGIAILGILVMNIQAFSMPFAAYSNLGVFEQPSTTDYWVWGVAHLFAEMKFMTLFSILFGAGAALMLERLEAKGLSAAAVHYRRSLGLLLIGAAHAYLLWYGDILTAYALCSMLLYFFRHVRPKRLLIVGIVVLCVSPLLTQVVGRLLMPQPAEAGEAVAAETVAGEEGAASGPPAETAADAADAAGEEEAAEEPAAGGMMMPTPEALEAEIAAYRGGWLDQMASRVPLSLKLQTWGFAFFILWRALGLMLIGMALYKWGVITAGRSRAFYRKLAWWGFGIGFPLCIAGMTIVLVKDFEFGATFWVNSLFNYFGSAGVSLGYLALVMLWCLSPGTSVLRRTLAAVGRMALTNYLLQTLLCIFVFYGGFGLGWFGHMSRLGQLGVVAAVWAFELLLSPWWLARFRFGPAEWLWRSMTYLKPQPMRRAKVGL